MLSFDVFEKWGIDTIGPLPMTIRGKCYILTAVDYLLRWAKACVVKKIDAKDVARFVYEDICCKFGVPLELLSERGLGFCGEIMNVLCKRLKITCCFSSPYYP